MDITERIDTAIHELASTLELIARRDEKAAHKGCRLAEDLIEVLHNILTEET